MDRRICFIEALVDYVGHGFGYRAPGEERWVTGTLLVTESGRPFLRHGTKQDIILSPGGRLVFEGEPGSEYGLARRFGPPRPPDPIPYLYETGPKAISWDF
jgi:hypothetical protein